MTRRRDPARSRSSSIWLLVALALLFVATPFIQDLSHGELLESCLVTLVMLFALVALDVEGRLPRVALPLLAAALAARWSSHLRPELVPPVVYLATAAAFFALVVARILRFVLHTPRVDANMLCAGLSGYLILGLLWAPVYELVGRVDPGAFHFGGPVDAHAAMDGFHAFYFSFVTLTTVGYGDVAPVSNLARTLAIVEAIAGLFYVAVLISRLVAIFSTSQSPAAEGAWTGGADERGDAERRP